MILFYIFF